MALDINDGPQGWWRARIRFTGEPPLDVLPVLTNDPATYRRGLELNYSEADEIQMWECDADGSPFQPPTEATKKRKTQGTLPPQPQTRPQEAKRPPGMGKLFE